MTLHERLTRAIAVAYQSGINEPSRVADIIMTMLPNTAEQERTMHIIIKQFLDRSTQGRVMGAFRAALGITPNEKEHQP